MRRFGVAFGVLAFIATLAQPAIAGNDTKITIYHAPEGSTAGEARQWTPAAGSRVTGSYKIRVRAEAQSWLRSFSVAIEPDPSAARGIPPLGQDASASQTYACCGYPSAELELSWDSTKTTPHNGLYRIVAQAESQLGETATALVQSISVDNPAAAPYGVQAKLDGSPVVTWARNQEPDITGYRIYRVTRSSAPALLSSVQSTSFKDVNAPRGEELRYEVVAVRYSPVSSQGIASARSNRTQALIMPAPAASQESDSLPAVQQVKAPAPLRAAKAPRYLPESVAGFETLLPYDAPPPQRFLPAEQPGASGVAIAARAPVRERRPSSRYAAASILMLVAALHLARASHRLLTSAGNPMAAQRSPAVS